MTNAKTTTDKPKRAFGTLFAAAAIALSLVGLGAPEAEARNVCMKHSDLTGVLQKHKESQAAIGVASNGNLIQVYATEDGATWSIVMTNPQGVSCVMAVGKDWDQRAKLLVGEVS